MKIWEALCALTVAFLCNHVEATDTAGFQFYFNYPIKDYEKLLFEVTCIKSCTIYGIRVEGIKGQLEMKAFSASGTFCQNHAKRCPHQELKENIFYITLKPKPEFKGGSLTVTLGHEGWMKELNADCASTLNYVRIKSGSFAIKFPKLPRLYEIQCHGNCIGIEFFSETSEKVILAAAEEPIFVKDGGCYNCFCLSNKNQGYKQKCVKDGNRKFDLEKSSIYVTLVPNTEIKDVKAFVLGDNIKSIKEYIRKEDIRKPVGWPVYDTKDGYRAVVHGFERAPRGSRTFLKVYCKEQKFCDDMRLEVFADTKVTAIRAGKLSFSGRCNDCSCTDIASCKRRTRPKMYDFYGLRYFDIFIQMEGSQLHYPAYVKISGKNVDSTVLNFNYVVD